MIDNYSHIYTEKYVILMAILDREMDVDISSKDNPANLAIEDILATDVLLKGKHNNLSVSPHLVGLIFLFGQNFACSLSTFDH